MLVLFVFFYLYGDHLDLHVLTHPFPTRRSSVLAVSIMALFFVPYAYSLLRHSMDRLNPELEEAAAICGATQLQTMLGVVLPLLWPSLLSSVDRKSTRLNSSH